jgi:HAD superfamily hydrolase (TIGR01457 family)
VTSGEGLRGCPTALAEAYDVGLVDLDGVVYVGGAAVRGATDSLHDARARGMRLAFVTNNSSRTPETVAARLCSLGVEASAEQVVTSAQASATMLRERLDPGAKVLVVGGEGLRRAVSDAGLVVVATFEERPVALAQGYSTDVGYRELAEAALAIRAGAVWVASNADVTIPSARGLLPGNGAMVAALRAATGREPLVAGKPDLPLHAEAVRRTGAHHPLVIGDRLDTDIEGAVRAGTDSLLVLTGVSTAADVLAAPAGARPTYLARDLRGLLGPHPAPVAGEGGATCGGWRAVYDGAAVRLERCAADRDGDDGLDPLRAMCAAAWARGAGRIERVDGPPEVLSGLDLE